MATSDWVEPLPIRMLIKIKINASNGNSKRTPCPLDWLAKLLLDVASDLGANIKMALAIMNALINHVIWKSLNNLIDNHYHLGCGLSQAERRVFFNENRVVDNKHAL